MKMFFDLPGFIFAVGLDEEVIDRALRANDRERGRRGFVDQRQRDESLRRPTGKGLIETNIPGTLLDASHPHRESR